ncbi:MAG: hypothetical protein AB4352_08860 [Hormoscilla sp.]
MKLQRFRTGHNGDRHPIAPQQQPVPWHWLAGVAGGKYQKLLGYLRLSQLRSAIVAPVT